MVNDEPTERERNPYESYIYISTPPPPPSVKQSHKGRIVAVISMISLVMLLGAGFIVVLHTNTQQNRSQATATRMPTLMAQPTPTIDPNYTAMDIVNKLIADNLLIVYPTYGQTLEAWLSYGPYQDASSVPFLSSATWDTCANCDGNPMGVWVYSSNTVANTVYQTLLTDEGLAIQTPATVPMNYPSAVLYGHCLANVNGSQTAYAVIVQQYCI